MDTRPPQRDEPPAPVDPGDEWVDLVDGENRVVGRARRRDVRRQNLLHRGVGIFCRSSRGELYVHRRTTTKDVFPGMYDMLVGGVVGAGERYEAAARREIAEELGIVGPEPTFLFHYLYVGTENKSWVAVYEVAWDGPIRHQESEVAWGSFLSLDELRSKLGEWTFVPDGMEIFRQSRYFSSP